MTQDLRDSYRTRQSLFQEFYHSCFGKLVILLILLLVLFIIAVLTVPSNEKMEKEMTDDIRECIQENDSIPGDALDDAIGNVLHIFSEADTTINDKELMETFYKYNTVEYFRHTFYATARIRNNFRPEGTRVGIGIFGVVIPTVNFNDFLMHIQPIRNYNKNRPIGPYYGDEYVGENPDVTEYHYEGDPDQ